VGSEGSGELCDIGWKILDTDTEVQIILKAKDINPIPDRTAFYSYILLNTQHRRIVCVVYRWVFCTGCPVSVCAIYIICVGRMFDNSSYRNSRVFDSTSGTEQSHPNTAFRNLDKNLLINFHFPKSLTCTTIHHSPTAQFKFLNYPAIVYILPPNISLSTLFLNSSLQLNIYLHYNISVKKCCCKITVSKLKPVFIVHKYHS